MWKTGPPARPYTRCEFDRISKLHKGIGSPWREPPQGCHSPAFGGARLGVGGQADLTAVPVGVSAYCGVGVFRGGVGLGLYPELRRDPRGRDVELVRRGEVRHGDPAALEERRELRDP